MLQIDAENSLPWNITVDQYQKIALSLGCGVASDFPITEATTEPLCAETMLGWKS